MYKSIYDLEEKKEDQRLLVSITIVATAISAIAVLPGGLWNFLKFTLSFSATYAFFYLLMTASHLKYSDKYRGTIWEFEFPKRFRKSAYDNSIDIFGVNAFIFLAFVSYDLLKTRTW